MRVAPFAGREFVGPQRQIDRIRALAKREKRARHMPQNSRVVGCDRGSARKILDRVSVQSSAGEETAGVDRKFDRMRFELTGARSMLNGTVEIAGNSKRAARMAMTRSPSRAAFEQPLIGGGRRPMMSTIAEQPSTKIRNCRATLQIKRGMGAVDRFRHLPAVIKRFTEPAIKLGPLQSGQLELIQLRTTGFEFARGDRALQTLDIRRSRALVTHPNGALSHMGRQAVQTLPENLHLREYLAVSSKPRRCSVRSVVQSKNS
jgi:hypothetical protein